MVDPKCSCKCDGQTTPLTDTRCEGFAGELSGTFPPPPTPRKPKALSIILRQTSQDGATSNAWTFFETEVGKSADGCADPVFQDNSRTWVDNDAINNPPWPHGTFTMKLYGEDNCQYLSDGTNPGILRCPSMSENASCYEEQDKSSQSAIDQCLYSLTVTRSCHRVAHCEW